MKIYKSAIDLIGDTPLVELNSLTENTDFDGKIYAKVEFFNPAGSVKDRVALSMIENAEKRGEIGKNTVIIEPTSGNTGIGLALVSAVKGYKAIIVMPDTMSPERIGLIKAYGAEVVLTDGKLGMQGAIDKARELKAKYGDVFIPDQFSNNDNPTAHYNSTAKEIYDALDGKVDIFVAGIGSGGTISGTGKYLKEQNKNVKIVGVEPFSSPMITKGQAGAHKIQGIGANFIPSNLDLTVIDEIITVHDDDALTESRNIARKEGLLVGISSGAVLSATKTLVIRPENKGKTIVVLFPDTGDRYLSTELFK